MKNIGVLIPLPTYGFDPTESAVPWKLLTEAGVHVAFATPGGQQAAADERMVTGKGLGPWKSVLPARRDAVDAYQEMIQSAAFSHPLRYDEVVGRDCQALLLPGGHDKGVREYLESPVLQRLVGEFFLEDKPVAAICHGVLLAARSLHPETGKSVLFGRKTTSLLRIQELLGYWMTALWLKDYYLTYPGRTVEGEVRSQLQEPEHYIKGSRILFRDSADDDENSFSVRDKNYVSARWPGDVYHFTSSFLSLLRERDLCTS